MSLKTIRLFAPCPHWNTEKGVCEDTGTEQFCEGTQSVHCRILIREE